MKELVPLALGILLTAAALAAAGRRIAAVERDIRRQTAPVEVVVASVPIAAGEPFSERNLARKSLPSAGTGKRNVPASEFELLLGASAKIPVAAGEPVLWTDVEEPYETEAFSRRIAPGHRAITMEADISSSFAGMLHTGDRVDLLCGKDGTSPQEWVRDIPVVAVDRHHSRPGKPPDGAEPATVTLMVTPQEGARISTLAGSGKLHWFLRNPLDNTAYRSPGMPGLRRSHPVEIWKAGVRVLSDSRGTEMAQ